MAKVKLNTTFRFSSSHFLTEYHGNCENLHGHNYKLIVTIEGDVEKNGMLMDFKKIKEIVNNNAVDLLDHAHLNEIIKNPSAENLLIWIWEKLKDNLPLNKLTLYETEDYFAEYEGK